MDLSIGNVVNVSIAQSQLGAGKYNTSNMAVFTREAFADSFGVLGYKLYLDPSGVELDFGSDSDTLVIANKTFGQQPSIRTGRGYLAVIPFLEGVDQQQTISFNAVAASGSFVAKWGSASSALILWNDNAAAIQAKIRALPGLGAVVVTGSIAARALVVQLVGVGGDPAVFTFMSVTLATVAPAAVVVSCAVTTHGTNETLDEAIVRTQGLVQYFGIQAAEITPAAIVSLVASLVQTMRKIAFIGSRTAADVAPAGMLDLLRGSAETQTRGLYYGATPTGPAVDSDVIAYVAAYASSGMSVDFAGIRTTRTQQMKTLEGVLADASIDQTLLNQAKAAGVDVYASIEGVAKLLTSGANMFFDRVYNQLAFAGDLAIANFNALAQTATKVAQTEDDMRVLKGASRRVCEQYKTNLYLAKGKWTDPTTFGNEADFLRNILEQAYYIFTQPIAQQDPADREARHAPLQQIAVKEAGAMHDAALLININP